MITLRVSINLIDMTCLLLTTQFLLCFSIKILMKWNKIAWKNGRRRSLILTSFLFYISFLKIPHSIPRLQRDAGKIDFDFSKNTTTSNKNKKYIRMELTTLNNISFSLNLLLFYFLSILKLNVSRFKCVHCFQN